MFIARLIWSYFYEYKTAVDTLELNSFESVCYNLHLLENLELSAAVRFIRNEHQLSTQSTNFSIFLLVDEFHSLFSSDERRTSITKEEKDDGVNLLQDLCDAILDKAENPNDNIIICSLDPFVMHSITAKSGRPVMWIPLVGLDNAKARAALGDEEEIKSFSEDILNQCLELANGHPRSLQGYYTAIKAKPPHLGNRDLFLVLSDMAVCSLTQTVALSEELIATGFLGDSIPLETEIDGKSCIDLIANTVYIHNKTNMNFIPRLAGLLLLKEIMAQEQPSTQLRSKLKDVRKFMIENSADESSHKGILFEKFHYHFEILKQICRQLCASFIKKNICWSLTTIEEEEFIKCSIFGHYNLQMQQSNFKWMLATPKTNFKQECIIFQEKLLWPISTKRQHEVKSPTQLLEILEKGGYPYFIKCTGSFPGIDAVIICLNAEKREEVWCILLEMKFTCDIKSNTSTITGLIKEKLNKVPFMKDVRATLQKRYATCRVISVFIMWHSMKSFKADCDPWPDNLTEENLPDALLLIGREQLSDFYVSLMPLYSIDKDCDRCVFVINDLILVKSYSLRRTRTSMFSLNSDNS